MRSLFVVLTGLLFFCSLSSYSANKKPTQISIGTGNIVGLYYPTGGAICQAINKEEKNLNIHCVVEATSGSLQNLELLEQNKIQFAIVQSDWQYHAYKGTEAFKDKKQLSNLRSVFSIHGEPFTVVVRKNSDIKNFTELKGHAIDIGEAGSGANATMRKFMKAMGWTEQDFKSVTQSPLKEQGQMLCDNKTDAFISMFGHPNATLKEIALTCPVKIVPVESDKIKELTKISPFYVPMQIKANEYRGTEVNINTFGAKATLVTTTAVPNWIVYDVVKVLFNNIETFKKAHPAFADLTPQSMMVGNSAPYAEGALQFYKEKGWIFNLAE